MPGSIITSLIVVSSFVYFIYTGTVATIWPMFGSANQLLGTFALVVATSFIINRGKIKYVWVTLVPLVFIGIITVTAGLSNIFGIYLPMLSQSGHIMQGIINLILTALILIGLFIVFIEAVPKWIAVVRGKKPLIPDGK
jgi:carbon starvation protein